MSSNIPTDYEEYKKWAQAGEEARNQRALEAEPEAGVSGISGVLADIGKGTIGGVLDATEAVIDIKDIFVKEPLNIRSMPEVETKSAWGDVANVIAQEAVGFIGAGKVLKFLKPVAVVGKAIRALEKSSLAHNTAKGAIVDYTVFDENEERLSNIIQQVPILQNPVTEFLATSPDDSPAVSRLKNTIEGMALGFSADLVIGLAKVARKRIRGSSGKALHDETVNEAATLDAVINGTEPNQAVKQAAPATELPFTKEEIHNHAKKADSSTYSNYEEFKSSNRIDAELKRVTDEQITDIVKDIEKVRNMGEDDIAKAFGEALGGNKKFTEFLGGLDDTRLYTVVTEAVLDKLPKRGTKGIEHHTDIVKEFRLAAEMGLVTDDAVRLASDKASDMAFSVRDMVKFRAVSYAKLHDIITMTYSRLGGDIEGTGALGGKIKEWAEFAGDIQTVVTESARILKGQQMPVEKANLDATIRKVDAAQMLDIAKKQRLDAEKAELRAKYEKAAPLTQEALLKSKPLNQVKPEDLRIDPKSSKLLLQKAETLDINNPEQLKAFVAIAQDSKSAAARVLNPESRPAYIGKSAMAYIVNNMLSAPATHVGNLITGALKLTADPAIRMLGGIATSDKGQIMHGLYQYGAMASVAFDSAKMALMAFRTGTGVLDKGAKGAETAIKATRIRDDFKAMWAKDLIDKGAPVEEVFKNLPPHIDMMANIAGYLGSTLQLPVRTMGMVDEFFKQMAYRSSMSAKAMRMVAEQELTGTARSQYVKDYVSGSLDNGIAKDSAMLGYAREMTWQQPLSEGDNWLRNAGHHFSQIPQLKPFIPFIQTPTNLLIDILEHTPAAAVLFKEVREGLAAGGEAEARIKGKMAFGTALCGMATAMAANGTITGGYPNDPTAKQLWLDTGRMPYSFKVGDKYIPYNRLDPYGSFFGIAADLYDMQIRAATLAMPTDDNTLQGTAMHYIAATVKTLGNKSYAQGLANMAGLINAPESASAGRVIKNLSSSLVPFSSLMRWGARQVDPYQKEVQTMTESLRASIPGLSESVPTRHSWITGRPVEYNYFYSDAKEDAVLEEVLKYAEPINGGRPVRNIGNVKLTSEQYAELCRLQGTVRLGGRTLYESLETLMSSDEYNSSLLDDDNTDMRAVMIGNILKQYQKASLNMLKYNDAQLRNQLSEAKRQKLWQKTSPQPKPARYDLSRL